MREQARQIREVAIGFGDAVSATLLELADGMEADAARLEGDEPPEATSTRRT